MAFALSEGQARTQNEEDQVAIGNILTDAACSDTNRAASMTRGVGFRLLVFGGVVRLRFLIQKPESDSLSLPNPVIGFAST